MKKRTTELSRWTTISLWAIMILGLFGQLSFLFPVYDSVAVIGQSGIIVWFSVTVVLLFCPLIFGFFLEASRVRMEKPLTLKIRKRLLKLGVLGILGLPFFIFGSFEGNFSLVVGNILLVFFSSAVIIALECYIADAATGSQTEEEDEEEMREDLERFRSKVQRRIERKMLKAGVVPGQPGVIHLQSTAVQDQALATSSVPASPSTVVNVAMTGSGEQPRIPESDSGVKLIEN